ncbi:MAG: four helix bundle protein [Flavipsychrobacter sp.]|jgi:four helix bundle protein|nr:four helix bundle protein [Flavipsychrobacter sp.]
MENDKVYKSFTDLEVWQGARRYKNSIYQLVKSFPAVEKYRLEDQLIRASRSIGSNISEGYGRYTYKDQLHFCIQARGSLYETINDCINAFDCNYISESTLNEYKQQALELEKLLNGYIAWLKKMIDSKNN